jgi:hypothetical protein
VKVAWELGRTDSRLLGGSRGNMKTTDKVMGIINRHDPMGLLNSGAPLDEYSPEVDSLRRLYENGDSITPSQVVDVFEYWFWDGCISFDKAKSIADEL